MSSDRNSPEEIVAPYWDIFSPPVEDISTTEYEFVEYLEKRVNVSTLNDYELINQDLDLFILPSNSYLRVGLNLTSTNGNAFTKGNIALVNNGFNLFSRAQYMMNNTLIEDIDFPGLTTQVMGIVERSKNFSDSSLLEMWAPDYCSPNGSIFGKQGVFQLTGIATGDAAQRALSIGAANALTLAVSGQADNAAITFTANGTAVNFVGGGLNLTILQNGAAGNNLPMDNNSTAVGAGTQIQVRDANGRPLDVFARIPTTNPAGSTIDVPVTISGNGTNFSVAAVNGAILPVTNTAVLYVAYQNRGQPNYNPGFEARKNALFDANTGAYDQELILWLPISRLFKIFEQNKRVFRGVKHTIRLWKNIANGNNDLLIRDIFAGDSVGADLNGVITINKMSWYIPILKPSPSVELSVNQQLNSGKTTSLYWNALQCIQSAPISAGPSTYNWRVTATSKRPVRMFVVFQNQARFNSQYQNNMLFDNLDMSNIYVRIGSTQFPKEQYGPLVFTPGATEDISRLYNAFLQAGNFISDINSGGCLSYSDFRDSYPIFCFDLSAQDNGIWANSTELDIQLYLTTNSAMPNCYAFAVIEFERQITIKGAASRIAVEV